MKAKVRRGNLKGTVVEISQWCNDWFTLNTGVPSVDRKPVSPSSLAFTHDGIVEIQKSNSGILFQRFELANAGKKMVDVFPYVFTFKKRKF